MRKRRNASAIGLALLLLSALMFVQSLATATDDPTFDATVEQRMFRLLNADRVKRLIACSGKVYYDLVRTRADRKNADVAIVRVEQLYPFPHKAFAAELKKYPSLSEVVWCQDEPQNQGAWFFVQHYIHENMSEGQRLGYAGRPPSASPAVGYAHLHQEQQKALLEQAFGKLKGFVLTK